MYLETAGPRGITKQVTKARGLAPYQLRRDPSDTIFWTTALIAYTVTP
jgi:hypothetical protein